MMSGLNPKARLGLFVQPSNRKRTHCATNASIASNRLQDGPLGTLHAVTYGETDDIGAFVTITR